MEKGWQGYRFSWKSPQEGGGIPGEQSKGIAGVAIGIICLALSAALVAVAPRAALTPAALVLIGVSALALVLLLARRAPAEPPTSIAAEPEPAVSRDEPLPQPDDAILRFTREITRPASFDQIQLLISRQLPVLIGAERAWIVARLAGRQRLILPVPSSGQERSDPLFGSERADWTTYPLVSGGSLVGVLGVEVTGRRLSESALTVIRAVAPILAHALLTADATDRLRETSIRDPLTGCATRPHGLERLGIELKRSARSGSSVAVLMVDLDHFKDVNDRFGHNAGDAVLSAVGRTMLQTLRASDIRCRWGGEEFLIVLPETTLEPARQVAEALLRRIAEAPVQSRAGAIKVTASIGLTLARPGEEDIETLIGRADRALYRAKAEGRACVRIVLGDMKGAPIGGPHPPAPLPFRDRRDPNRPDRRRVPGPGRRKTDMAPGHAGREEGSIPRTAGDRASRP